MFIVYSLLKKHFEMKTSKAKNMDFPEAICVHHFQEAYSLTHRLAQGGEGQRSDQRQHFLGT